MCWNPEISLLEEGVKLKWVQLPYAGIPESLTHWVKKQPSPPIFTTASGVAAPAVAEQVLAYILAFNRRLPEAVRFQTKHEWGQEYFWNKAAFPLCEGQTALIFGYGAIGKEIARRLIYLGIRIIGIRRDPLIGKLEFSFPKVETYCSDSLFKLLPQADWLIITAPLTTETHGIINETAFSRMKPEAGLINVSRGELVDEKALLESLRKRKIQWAALDVFWEEPLPADHPLWSFPNVIITPHIAGTNNEYTMRLLNLFSDNLERFINNIPLHNLVDFNKGY